MRMTNLAKKPARSKLSPARATAMGYGDGVRVRLMRGAPPADINLADLYLDESEALELARQLVAAVRADSLGKRLSQAAGYPDGASAAGVMMALLDRVARASS